MTAPAFRQGPHARRLARRRAADARATGTSRRVEDGAAPRRGDERHALGVPAIANLHSHAFQRAMAGLAETRGTSRDTFWTWRETMYRFALGMTPDDVEAVATELYVEMLEAGFARRRRVPLPA